jgi:hypothetical protein
MLTPSSYSQTPELDVFQQHLSTTTAMDRNVQWCLGDRPSRRHIPQLENLCTGPSELHKVVRYKYIFSDSLGG